MNGLSGFALAGYLKDLDRKREKGLNALQQLRESQKHAELSGLADFDLMERARELGLTGEFSQVPEVQAFLSEPIETRMKQQKLETGDLALQSAKSKAEREQRAGEALNKTLSDIRLQNTLGQIDFSQGLKDQGFQTNPKSNRDIAMENLTPYMDDARVQGFVSSFLDKPNSERAAFNRIGARKEFDTPENRERTKAYIASNAERLGLTPEQVAEYNRQIDVGWVYDIQELLREKELGGSLTRENKVRDELALLGPRTQTAASTAKARKIGTAEGETFTNINAIPGLRPIPGIKITDTSVNKVKDAQPEIQLMTQMIDELINKYNTTGSVFTGDDAADYSSKVRNLQLIAKSPSLYNLGVLTGPDLKLLEEAIPNPASIREGVKKQVLGNTIVRLNNFKQLLSKKADAFYTANGFQKIEKSPVSQPNGGNNPDKAQSLRQKYGY